MASRLKVKEWYLSRGIDPRTAEKIVSQLKKQYLYISQVLRGEPVPDKLIELELVQLIHDVQQKRFPVKSFRAQ